MFSDLIVAYLFFGGAGAGTLLLTALLDAFAKKRFLATAIGAPCASRSRDAERRARAFALLCGEGFVAFGVMCLIFDLGRIDRIDMLFLAPSFSYISLGTFSLAILLILGFLCCLVAFFDGFSLLGRIAFPLEIALVPFSLFVMVYTGVLLFGVGAAIALWDSIWIPALFLSSSISCGCAVVLIAAVLAGESSFVRPTVRAVLRVDMAAIACEALFAALFVVDFAGGKDGSWQPACSSLFSDENILIAWWLGFVLCGLVVPFICEAVMSRRFALRFEGSFACVFMGILILFGGWCLRWSIVEAAQWQDMQLAYPQEDARANALVSDSDSMGLTEYGAFRDQ